MMNQQAHNSHGCSRCGVDDCPFLHHINHLGILERFCTACILQTNSQSFCPTCFQIYDNSPFWTIKTVTCFKCYSNSHSSCVGPNPKNPYICPLCTNDFFPILDWKNKEFDKKSAAALLAATKISVDSTAKAAASANEDAEKKTMEAASARKSAMEAMEHLARETEG